MSVLRGQAAEPHCNHAIIISLSPHVVSEMDRDFEGGFGGQEDLEDRYATTSGEH